MNDSTPPMFRMNGHHNAATPIESCATLLPQDVENDLDGPTVIGIGRIGKSSALHWYAANATSSARLRIHCKR